MERKKALSHKLLSCQRQSRFFDFSFKCPPDGQRRRH
ncbi:hypothetical protein D918_05863 [Trichuris suis]|nr:hypothetical protein D918_05863 [Trichuris suis]